jgi:thiamine-monophosphate kinase
MSESAFLDHLRRTAIADPRVPIGIGDDLAAIAWNTADLLLVGADQMLDGVHFDAAVHTPHDIGRKAMLRNLSDCAAMACVPVAAVVTLALPRGSGETLAMELTQGIRAAAVPYRVVLVGGDTGSWAGPLAVTVTILARSAGLQPVRRTGAKVGDKLFVTGPLGGSILGRHMNIVPRVDLALELAARFELHAMLDLSDGLSRDLPRLCDASGVGAVVDAARVPIHDDARRMLDSRSPLSHALHDGEDHELLFAAAECDHSHVTEIGRIVGDQGVWLREGDETTPLVARGWEHEL